MEMTGNNFRECIVLNSFMEGTELQFGIQVYPAIQPLTKDRFQVGYLHFIDGMQELCLGMELQQYWRQNECRSIRCK